MRSLFARIFRKEVNIENDTIASVRRMCAFVLCVLSVMVGMGALNTLHYIQRPKAIRVTRNTYLFWLTRAC